MIACPSGHQHSPRQIASNAGLHTSAGLNDLTVHPHKPNSQVATACLTEQTHLHASLIPAHT